ncbi:hypothetical protein Rt10032_c01g0582 [Rhodotorula toruloides]|uniref:Uncharacterized protein n=1 Tax=Rhodotorula toruloides TaxID=5286 RepID=A0A511K977_RHOTO|nr:hypothetical protein Rt10032_c01g0582 [Rhodotorula toruloides]
MPSIKSCLASLALVALAFAPVNASKATSAGVVARNQHVERSVKSSAAVARRDAAAKALKKRAGRATGRTTFANRKTAASSKGNSASNNAAPVSKTDPYAANSAFLNTKAALAAAKIRCGTNAICRTKGPAAPANGDSFCIAGSCTFRCNPGYAPGGTDGTQCVPSQTQCGGTTCDVPQFGYATCNTDGTCNIGCAAGYQRYSTNVAQTGPYHCFATQTDAANCGTPGNACPASYNGIGEPVCKFGTCRVSCPVGYALRRAQSATNPYYCYNGLSSLGPA